MISRLPTTDRVLFSSYAGDEFKIVVVMFYFEELSYKEIAAAGGGIHSSVRDLRQRSEDELFDFPSLAKFHQLTDGNLGAHLEKLEAAGYIEIRKRFHGKKPRTEVLATVKGRSAFADHTEALKQIIDGV